MPIGCVIQQNQGRAVGFPVAVCALREHLAKLPSPFRDLSAGLFVTFSCFDGTAINTKTLTIYFHLPSPRQPTL